MKNKLLFGAIATAIATFGLGVTQAQALNLTGGGSGTTNAGLAKFTILEDGGLPPAGSGKINSFLRVQETGNGDGFQEGFNTDYRDGGQPPLDGVPGNFTRNLFLSDVPVVDLSGSAFRRFILDLNDPNGGDKALVDLLDLKIYLSPTGSLASLSGLTPIFSLGETVNLKDVNSGSGKYDLLVDISNSLFTGSDSQYLYLYSKFGRVDGGYEEWSVGTTRVPTPAAVLPVLGGLFGAAFRRQKKEQLS